MFNRIPLHLQATRPQPGEPTFSTRKPILLLAARAVQSRCLWEICGVMMAADSVGLQMQIPWKGIMINVQTLFWLVQYAARVVAAATFTLLKKECKFTTNRDQVNLSTFLCGGVECSEHSPASTSYPVGERNWARTRD